MVLKSKTEPKEQVSFEDLVFEVEFEEERVFTTISGKEYMDVQGWTKFGMSDLDVDEIVEGVPELTYFENKDRKSDSIRFRVADDGEFVDLYINIPKPDPQGFITNIRKGFDFYRKTFDFIFSILRMKGESNVIDSNGEEVNNFKKVNIFNFAKYVDQMNRVTVKITEGNPESDYNSFIILKME